jgi:O-antigen ligase
MRSAPASLHERAATGTLPSLALLAGLAVLSTATAVLAAPLAAHPSLVALGAAGLAALAAIGALARRYGAPVLWVGAALVAIMAGEMSSLSVGGQNGKLLWADFVIGAGAAAACVRGRLAVDIPRAPVLDRLWPLLAWCALSLLIASDPLTAAAELKEWLAAAVLCAGSLAAAPDARRARLLLVAVASIGALTGAGMLYVAATSPLGAPIAIMKKLVDLPWGRTNYLAGLLILAIPLLLGLMGEAATFRARFAAAAGLVLSVAGLAVSASKGAILALAVALALTFGLARRQSRAPRLIVLAVFAVGVAMYAAGPLKQVTEMRLQTSALDYSAGERMDLYRLAWEQFLRHPLFGVGLNVFSVVSHRLHGLDTVPHNFELGFLAELGLPGLLLVLAWVAALGAGAHRALRHAATPRERSLALGLWAAFIAFALHNQVESTIYGEQYKLMLLVYGAAAWTIGREWQARAESAPPAA